MERHCKVWTLVYDGVVILSGYKISYLPEQGKASNMVELFQEREIKYHLNSVEKGKVCAPDEFPIELWCSTEEEGTKLLTKLFN